MIKWLATILLLLFIGGCGSAPKVEIQTRTENVENIIQCTEQRLGPISLHQIPNQPRVIEDKFGQKWAAVTPLGYERLAKNIEILGARSQELRAIIAHYKRCIERHNERVMSGIKSTQ